LQDEVVSGDLHGRALQGDRWARPDLETIGEVDGLDDGGYFVEAVRALAEHIQRQIDLGVSSCDQSRARNSAAQPSNVSWPGRLVESCPTAVISRRAASTGIPNPCANELCNCCRGWENPA